jgi:hypothetical protein
MSVKELSDKTKIRAFAIEAIEKGDFSIMSEVYIKSFIKTLTTYLKIEYSDIPAGTIKPKTTKKKFDDEKIEKEIATPKIEPAKDLLINEKYFKKSKEQEPSHFSELFKKKNINKDKRYNYLNKAIYIVLFLAISTAIYFAFTSLNNSSSRIDNSDINTGSDTISLEEESNNLFTYFEKPDSLRLTAKAHDTVWMRVLIDGKSIFESLLKPGTEDSWAANDFFIVDMGNVGGADLFRNGEKLPVFGNKGTVVKNVKITATEVTNMYNPKSDSIRAAKRKKAQEDKQKQIPKIIEESKIQTSPQFQLQNRRDSIKF